MYRKFARIIVWSGIALADGSSKHPAGPGLFCARVSSLKPFPTVLVRIILDKLCGLGQGITQIIRGGNNS